MSTSPSPDAVTTASALDAPLTAPAALDDARFELAMQYLRGDGIEIGALHLAMLLPPGARARYVDRMPVPELRHHYPELAEVDLAPVDVIDDGERLGTIEPESQDFIVANHFLEHCQDPIGTLKNHLRKLRPGGILFYAVPDKRYTFDYPRAVTTLQHLIDDHERGPERSRSQHYLEWVEAGLAAHPGQHSRQEMLDQAAALERADYSIHFHVWTETELVELFFDCQERLGSFEVEAVRRNGIENIVVVRKRGQSPGRGSEDDRPDPPAAASVPSVARPLAARRRLAVPLSSLRHRLDPGSSHAYWSPHADGLESPAWVIATEATVTVALLLDRPLALTARARLLPHEWRDSVGGVEAWVAVTTAGGRELPWRSRLTPAMDPDGIEIEVPLPAGAVELQIGAKRRMPESSRATTQFALEEPVLAGPGVEPLPPPRRRVDPAPPAEGPLISVVCPVHDPPVRMLEETIDSVHGQTYRNWELVLVDDGSADPAVREALDRRAATSERIRLIRRPHAGGTSVATNVAIEHASGDYVALLDHDDLLAPHALAHVAGLLVRDPALDMVYTDEAVLDDGRVIAWHLKPDWSPETLATSMYVTHLSVFRRSLAATLGGFRSQYDGTQDYDFVLRLSEHTDRIAHVPEVLYYWRAHDRSTAGGAQAKPYAYAIQPRAIAEHLQRRGIDAEVQYGQEPGRHRIVHRVDSEAGVSLVVTAEEIGALAQAAGSWTSQPHRAWETVVSAPGDRLEAAANALRQWGLGSSRIVLVERDPDHDHTAALRAAAGHARARNLLLMRTPLLGLTHDWLARLLGYCSQPGVAAASPIVLTEDDRIAHAGIAIPAGLPLSLLHGRPGPAAPALCTNALAAEGVIAISTATYERLGGLEPGMGDVAIADLCLRAGDQLGLRTVIVSDARMRTLGPDLGINDLSRIWELGARYAAAHDRDPYYNPSFRTDRGDFEPPNLPTARMA